MNHTAERPRVYIVILNYNGWSDTIECLESVLRLNYTNYQVILVDNASQNSSVENIKLWAKGKLNVWRSNHNSLRHLSNPPLVKPVPLIEFNHQMEAKSSDIALNNKRMPKSTGCDLIILIHSGGNLGFAGGNNVGLRFALKENDFDYVWLLNNDTVVEPSALDKLVERMRGKPSAGICGSTLLFYHNPKLIQAQGGATFNKLFATSKHIGLGNLFSNRMSKELVEKKIAYSSGASMLVSHDFINSVGFMNEDFFLYFEEIDWALRGKKKSFVQLYASDSIVYHKEGGSIGSSSYGAKKSELADYYGLRNRITFTKKHFPIALLTVYLGLILTIINRIRRGQWKRILMIIKIILGR